MNLFYDERLEVETIILGRIECDITPTPCVVGDDQWFINDKGQRDYRIYPKKKEENMYTYNAEQETRQHLKNRISDIEFGKGRELRKKFGMEYAHPKNYKEALDWEKRGGMKVKIFHNDESDFDDFGWDVNWENPDNPRNEEGYRAAHKLLSKAYVDAKDAVLVYPPDEALKAVQEFEAKTFS